MRTFPQSHPVLTCGAAVCGLLAALFFSASCGCTQKPKESSAQDHVRRYEAEYQAAVNSYRAALDRGQDVEENRLRLGRLYLDRAEFSDAIAELTQSKLPEAKKYLAKALYATGDYTAALDVLDTMGPLDAQSRLDAGLTAEKLNLFDKALEHYRSIPAGPLYQQAAARIDAIEKKGAVRTIKDVAPDIAAIIARAPSPQNYPQAGAQILWCDESIRIRPDNKAVSEMHYVVKILNERGKEDFSETQIDYDSTYEKVQLVFARTIKPSGEVVEVGSRHLRDVSKYLNFPLYSNARVCIISFPEITEGSCIEYTVTIVRNQLINKKDFVEIYPLQSQEPIIAARLTVEFPAGRTMFLKKLNERYNDFGAQLEPAVEKGLESTVWRWEFKDIPQIIPEPAMPPVSEINPTLLFSTFASWDEIYRWWWGLSQDKMRADSAIKEQVKSLIAPEKSALDRLRAVYNFCAQDIRYVAVEYGQAGYEPHAAADIFKNKYGDCKDQAILLVTMLREAGFNAWPVLIPTRDAFDLQPDFPTMLFDHAIAAVEFEGRTVFMDPTAQTCSFGDLPPPDQERSVLCCRQTGSSIEQTPLYPPDHNLIRQSTVITVNPDESIAARKTITSSGVYDQAQRYWLLYTVPDVVKDQIAAKVQEIAIGAKLAQYKVRNLNSLNRPVELEYAFQGSEYLTQAGPLRIMPQLASLDTGIVAKEKRRYPLEMEFLDTKQTRWSVWFPANFMVKYMPQALKQESPWMSFTAGFSQAAGTVTMDQQIVMKRRRVDQEEYPEFKAFLEGLAKQLKQRVVLERKR